MVATRDIKAGEELLQVPREDVCLFFRRDMCVCTHIIYMYIHVYLYVHACTHTRTCIHTHTQNTHKHMYVMHLPAHCAYKHTYIYIHEQTHVHACTCMYNTHKHLLFPTTKSKQDYRDISACDFLEALLSRGQLQSARQFGIELG